MLDNGFLTGHVSVAIHDEDPAKESYTPGGAEAGRYGLIGFSGNFSRDVEGWYASVYHATRLLDPRIRRMGVAHAHGISLLYPLDPTVQASRIIVHPSDGGRDVPLEFSCLGEVPNPVPKTDTGIGAGFPVMAMLPRELQTAALIAFELEDERGRLIEGHASTPMQPSS